MKILILALLVALIMSSGIFTANVSTTGCSLCGRIMTVTGTINCGCSPYFTRSTPLTVTSSTR
jgi:hypothetical protein